MPVADPASVLWREGPLAYLAQCPCGEGEQRWLRGIALGAVGRYADAAAALRPLLASDVFSSLAASTLASHARQVGRHRLAQAWDERARPLARGSAYPAQALADATAGRAADAIGQGDLVAARSALSEAGAAAELAASWRAATRFGWVRAEFALLTDDPAAAVTAAQDALEAAGGAPRHEVKSTLIRGVARLVAGDPNGVADLRAAADAAAWQGLVTLEWPACAVLVSTGGAGTAHWAARAVVALRGIEAGLGDVGARRFLARADVAALLRPPT